MQDPNVTPTPTPAPAPAPEAEPITNPNPTPTPTPPTSVSSTAPSPIVTDAPNGKAGPIITILIIVLVLVGSGFAALLIHLSEEKNITPAESNTVSNEVENEKEDKEEEEKEEKKDDTPTNDNNTNSNSILLTYNQKSFTVANSYSTNIKNASRVYTLYANDGKGYSEIKDINSYLGQTLTIKTDTDNATASVITKSNGRTISAITIFGDYPGAKIGSSYKYKDLQSFISINYVPKGSFSIDDKSYQFDVTKVEDVKKNYNNVFKDSYGSSYHAKYKGYFLTFNFNSYSSSETLTSAMIDKLE